MPEGTAHDTEALREILQIVSEKVPDLLNQLRATLFSPQAGEDLGKAVGAFYKELLASGIPEEDALQMAKGYMSSLQGIVQTLKSSQ
jgi:hypothetical protein